MTREEAWFLIREIDRSYRQQTPVRTQNGTCLQWLRLDYTDEYLNQFDLYTGGRFMTSQVRMTASEQQTFLTRGIIEESIASSQPE